MANYNADYWEDRLTSTTPDRINNAIMRVYSSFPSDCMPQGVCDPMYMMNIIALELGFGDGKGNFKLMNSSLSRLQNIVDCDFGNADSEEIRNIKLDIAESLSRLNKLL